MQHNFYGDVMSSNSVRHNDDMNPFIRSYYDVKSLQSVLCSVIEGKTEEAYVIVRNSSNYPTSVLTLSQTVP